MIGAERAAQGGGDEHTHPHLGQCKTKLEMLLSKASQRQSKKSSKRLENSQHENQQAANELEQCRQAKQEIAVKLLQSQEAEAELLVQLIQCQQQIQECKQEKQQVADELVQCQKAKEAETILLLKCKEAEAKLLVQLIQCKQQLQQCQKEKRQAVNELEQCQQAKQQVEVKLKNGERVRQPLANELEPRRQAKQQVDVKLRNRERVRQPAANELEQCGQEKQQVAVQLQEYKQEKQQAANRMGQVKQAKQQVAETEQMQLAASPIESPEELPGSSRDPRGSDSESSAVESVRVSPTMSMSIPGWMGVGDIGEASLTMLPSGKTDPTPLLPKVSRRRISVPTRPPAPPPEQQSCRLTGEAPKCGVYAPGSETVLERSPSAQVSSDPVPVLERCPPVQPDFEPSPDSSSADEEVPEIADAFITMDLTYKQATALDNPERDDWLLAMRDEMESLESHGTWALTPRPPDSKILTACWLFTKKMGKDGKVERYKARLVSRGHLQCLGLEYDQTFAPVTSKATLRVFLAGIVHRKMFSRQLDVKSAHLNGKLEDHLNLYMQQPEGFVVPGGLVCKIIKSLYGLKQAPRLWSAEVRRVLTLAGFRPTASDPALYVRLDADGTYSWALTYIGDFWLALDNLLLYTAILEIMRKEGWIVTEMGVPQQFLSLDCDIELDSEGRCVQIVISQFNAINAMVERFKVHTEEKKYSTFQVPMVSGAATGDAVGSRVLPNNTLYTSLISSLIYLSTCTRPDIAYAVSSLSRFTAAPTQAHWQAAQRVLTYLRTHPSLGICYKHSPVFELLAYSGASSCKELEGRRSQTGLAFLASGGIVNWVSKRQITPAISTGAAEYQALAAAARDVQWLKHLRNDLGLPASMITIQCDNSEALSWCEDCKLEPEAQHIDIMHHYVKDLVLSQRLAVTKVHTSLQLACTFTKPLAAEMFWAMNSMLGLVSVKPGKL